MADAARAARRRAPTANDRDPDKPARMRVTTKGELIIPLAKPVTNGDGTEMHEVTLPDSPGFAAMAAIMDAIADADEELNKKAAIPDMLTPDEASQAQIAANLVERNEAAKDRNRLCFGLESPHAHALIEVIKEATGVVVTMDNLPGWAGHPSVCGEIMQRYQDPFAGRDVNDLLGIPATTMDEEIQ